MFKQAKSNRAMKTGQLHSQDSNNGITILYSLRFDSTKSIAAKRPPTMRQTLVNPTTKNPKHASVLQDNNIQYEQPLNPMQVAEIRATRIRNEKKQTQQQQQAAVSIQFSCVSKHLPKSWYLWQLVLVQHSFTLQLDQNLSNAKKDHKNKKEKKNYC